MLEGLMMALQPSYIFWLTVGVMMGMVVGTLPGLTATMGTALLVPFTFALPAGAGLAMLGGLYVCAMFSDAIPAVLVNTPGTPSAMATAFDGHPMTLQGRGQEAIVAACFSSALGTLFGAACYLLLAWPMMAIALKFGPPEFFWLGVFALTIIGSLAGKSMLKGLAGGAIGLLISSIGISHANEVARFTFGIPELRGGVSLVAALIGVFAIPQVLSMVTEMRKKEFIAEYKRRAGRDPEDDREGALRAGALLSLRGDRHLHRNPAWRRRPDRRIGLLQRGDALEQGQEPFGKGDVRGVTASEIANNACAPASLIPLVTLGVPGSSPAAVIAGALMLRGLNPGPELFQSNGTLVYSIRLVADAGRDRDVHPWHPVCASADPDR